MAERSLMTKWLPLILMLWLATAAHAARYTPDDLHRYEAIHFGNGFTAVLNARPATRNVAMRLVVDVGLLDFDCRDRELPHLAEHLLFSGTSTHSESQLDALIDSLGGRWNARTSAWSTTYWLDIHHANAIEGLQTLHAMVTDTQLDRERFEMARHVVHQEAGGEPGRLKQLMYRYGVVHGSGNRAYRAFLPASRAFCTYIDTANHLTIDDLEAFLDDHYVPQNMTLVAVGAFDVTALTHEIRESFGQIPARVPGAKTRAQIHAATTGGRYRSRFSPVLGSSAYVSLDFAVPHRFGSDRMALTILTSHLDQRLFELLRVERGLGYAPSAVMRHYGDATTLALSARVDVGDRRLAESIIEQAARRVAADGVPPADLARIKRGMLLRLGTSYETNASIAAFYATHAGHLREHDRFPDLEALIDGVDTALVHRLAREHLQVEHALRYSSVPTLSYGQLGAAGVLPMVGLVTVLTRRRRRRRQLRSILRASQSRIVVDTSEDASCCTK
jgi:predicted Zn-dependent peptidase